MTRIFSNVVADIDRELEGKFPPDFDYLAMIRKVSEDAGVDVQTKNNIDNCKQISLQGVWVAMERVHSLLATALAVYGARVINRDTPTSPATDTEGMNITKTLTQFTESTIKQADPDTENSNDTLLYKSKTTGQNEIKSESTKEVKNNCVQKKHNMKTKTFLKNGRTKPNSPQQVSDQKYESRNETILSTDSEEEEFNDSVSRKSDEDFLCDASSELPEQNVKRKRGRPRKYPAGFQSQRMYTKFKSKFNRRTKYSRFNRGANDDGIKLHRGRGRPRKFPEDSSDIFHCSECDFVAKTRNTLGDHKHRVHLASPTICDICQKVFPNRRYMKRHRSSHVEPQHCCDVCGKMYKIRKAMLEHKKTHEEGYSRPSFQCELCPKTFCSNYILSCHVKSEHLGQKKSFLCSVCGKSFTTKHSLQEHLNAHTGAKPHICEICGKGFCYESALRDHKFVHVGAKQFICDVCSKAFTQRSGLKMHMRIHQETKQFMCSDCGREFTQKQALQRHERVHKGDKPFICKLCSRTFSDASIIRRHMILVHKIHKDASTWREDIICKVPGAPNYHVEKISELEERVNQQISKTSAEVDVLAVAAKTVELPLGSGTTTPDVVHEDSTFPAYKRNEKSDIAQSGSTLTEDNSQDHSDQLGHTNFQTPTTLSQWFPTQKNDLGLNHLVKETFTADQKSELSGSTGDTFLDAQSLNPSHPQPPYTELPSRPQNQVTLMSKVQERELMAEGDLEDPNSTSYLSRYTTGHNHHFSQNAHVSPSPHYAQDSCKDAEDRPESYPSDVDGNKPSRHYSSTTDLGERPASYPQVISSQTNRQLYSPESLDYRSRSSHLPVAFTDHEERPVFSQENTGPSERTSQYPPVTSPSVRLEPPVPNSSSSFPASSTQPWSSMYAYYSHLASQFGMNLSDYPYMANSHQ